MDPAHKTNVKSVPSNEISPKGYYTISIFAIVFCSFIAGVICLLLLKTTKEFETYTDLLLSVDYIDRHILIILST